MRLTVRLSGPGGPVESRSIDDGMLVIGRAPDCDLVLVDPERTLSNRHCQIARAGNDWVLTDTSTNGVFIGQADDPLGRGQSVTLGNGDVVHLGMFEMRIAMEPMSERAPPGQVPGSGPVMRSSPEKASGGFDEGADFRSPFQAPTETPVSGSGGVALPFGHQDGPVGAPAAEPWLDRIDSGDYAHGMVAKRAGWDAPPDPARAPDGIGLSSGDPFSVFAADDGQNFSSLSEHLPATSTVMTVPSAGSVLPVDWDQPDQPAARDAAPIVPPIQEPPILPAPLPAAPMQAAPMQAAPLQLPPTTIPPAEMVSAILSAPGVAPGAADGGAAMPESTRAPPYAPSPVPRPWEAPVGERPVRPYESGMPPHPAEPPPAAPVPLMADAASLLAAFLDGAGLPQSVADQHDAHTLLRNAGAMVRTAVDGLRDIQSSRAMLKAELRIEQTMIRPRDNNALKFVPDLQACMMALLGEAPPGFMPGPACMQQSLDDLKRHEMAMVAAVGEAMANLLSQLDPERIRAEGDEDTGLGSMFAGAKKARYWQIFERLYAEVRARQEDPASRSLLGPMATAYARQITRAS